jgi:hypothetical protein
MPLPTQYTHKHKGRTTIPSAGFEPAIPATERLQACDLDRTAELQLTPSKVISSIQNNFMNKYGTDILGIVVRVSARTFSHLLGASVLKEIYFCDRVCHK